MTEILNKNITKTSKLPQIMNENFIKEFNKNKPDKEFFDICKKAGKLIDIRSARKTENE